MNPTAIANAQSWICNLIFNVILGLWTNFNHLKIQLPSLNKKKNKTPNQKTNQAPGMKTVKLILEKDSFLIFYSSIYLYNNKLGDTM